MNLDAYLYSSRSIPLESARMFIVKTLRNLGWGKIADKEVVLDVGCGPGGTTRKLILPLFQNCPRIFAMDALPDMIKLAKKQNYSSQIEYSVANIEEWSSLERWENQITKLVSILCFHWLKDQRKAFQNVYKLLQKGGEAAFFFALQTTFHATILEMQMRSKWSHLFKEVENYVPESQYKGHDDFLLQENAGRYGI
ncbi:Juvenile hormone acid O-methyltransferase like protein [Argiope bruennichi]|uniref:Juvenile hormone acid O-methyltransferase like protein n=1 Tax=Argiope bruennichi TaxID=94029 RepID=A0A8T0ET53_ARGBR|nr:Juvenile hormone acid O-methyltransferase like protein [Argiope bruennichi]